MFTKQHYKAIAEIFAKYHNLDKAAITDYDFAKKYRTNELIANFIMLFSEDNINFSIEKFLIAIGCDKKQIEIVKKEVEM